MIVHVIVVDTSALLAVALEEITAEECRKALDDADTILISAGTLTEALIVASRRNVRPGVERLVEGLAFRIVEVTPSSAKRAADAHERWGKGAHPAVLNFGDCFAYELARTGGHPLLYVGGDFARTDVESVLKPAKPPPPE